MTLENSLNLSNCNSLSQENCKMRQHLQHYSPPPLIYEMLMCPSCSCSSSSPFRFEVAVPFKSIHIHIADLNPMLRIHLSIFKYRSLASVWVRTLPCVWTISENVPITVCSCMCPCALFSPVERDVCVCVEFAFADRTEYREILLNSNSYLKRRQNTHTLNVYIRFVARVKCTWVIICSHARESAEHTRGHKNGERWHIHTDTHTLSVRYVVWCVLESVLVCVEPFKLPYTTYRDVVVVVVSDKTFCFD